MFCQFDQFGCQNSIFLVGVVRMGADRAIDVRKPPGDVEQARQTPHPRRDGDDTPDPRGFGARDDAVEIIGKVGEIEMAVAVDEHGDPTVQAAVGSTWRGNTPTGGGSWVPALIRVPSAAKSRRSEGTPRLSSIFAE